MLADKNLNPTAWKCTVKSLIIPINYLKTLPHTKRIYYIFHVNSSICTVILSYFSWIASDGYLYSKILWKNMNRWQINHTCVLMHSKHVEKNEPGR